MRKTLFFKTQLVLVLLLGMSITGCTVLTSSQVKEVKKFADAAKGYGTLPGDVVMAYAEISEENKLLNLTGYVFHSDSDTAETALEEMKKARESRDDFNKAANKANDALKILDIYAENLVTLTSDDYTNSLDESATALGQSLDKTLTAYNNAYDKKLSMIGSTVTQVVRGVGGIYLRHKQTQLLKEYVDKADPVIAELCQDIENVISGNVTPNLEALNNKLETGFTTLANNHSRLDLLNIERVNVLFDKLDSANSLASAAVSSAQKYRKAHLALKEALVEKKDLKNEIAQINSLVEEINAALKLKKKFQQ
ncbi:MAG: hypothetical protein ACLP9S_04655 [Syntrophales bacterium]